MLIRRLGQTVASGLVHQQTDRRSRTCLTPTHTIEGTGRLVDCLNLGCRWAQMRGRVPRVTFHDTLALFRTPPLRFLGDPMLREQHQNVGSLVKT